MTSNQELAALFEEFADYLDAKDVEYKPRAYRRAAENIAESPENVADLAAEGGTDAIDDIDGVGDAIAGKIVEYVETGAIEELDALREEYPVDMAALTAVEGVGPKTVGTLYEELGIKTLDDLESAASAGDIQAVKGFGAKTEQNILDGIPLARQASQRDRLGEARPRGERVVGAFRRHDAVERIELAGSLRRWKETIGDVDVLVGSDDPQTVVDDFADWDEADEVIEAGSGKASIRLEGVRVDLRVVAPDEFGSALQYFTGSKAHNVALRNVAIDRDLKMNEYGVFDVADVEDPDADQRAGERVAGTDEESMYDALDLPLIPPELREDRGEIEAAREGALPDLVETDAVRGDLHTHTKWSDGGDTIAEMAAGAAAFGHDYLAVTDHATGPGMVGGVGVPDEDLREQLEEVRSVASDADITVFSGVEANIGTDGSISVADDLLADLDCVVASPHAGLDGDGTERLLAAIEHPSVNILGHPTGRYINQREGLQVEIEAVAEAAAAEGVALEVNSNPARLDLGDQLIRAAVDAGATIAVNTDAHRPENFAYVRYGVHTARRGWAEAADVLNTRDAAGVRSFLEG
jgi:DNA polymerase (family 10)